MNERAQLPARRGREQERREVKYQVRAKTGPGPRDWNQLGVAFERRNGEGLVIKLNTLPIDRNWNGQLVLVPPYVDEDDYDPTTGEIPDQR